MLAEKRTIWRKEEVGGIVTTVKTKTYYHPYCLRSFEPSHMVSTLCPKRLVKEARITEQEYIFYIVSAKQNKYKNRKVREASSLTSISVPNNLRREREKQTKWESSEENLSIRQNF